MQTHERLVRYASVTTSSKLGTGKRPSTDCQWDLARLLKTEMEELGISNVRLDDKCYLYGEIPATPGYEDKTSIGFIAHIDTAPDFNGDNVHPQVIENYDGQDIVLKNGRVIETALYPHLKGWVGDTLVVTDGTSLLGADDKCGIAVIMTMAEQLLASDLPHGKVCVAFNPDEEIGEGAWDFDVEAFGADYAYTLDASLTGDLVYECFNGCEARINIQGYNVHPGTAKDKMINAGLIATQLAGMLPAEETPRHTSGYEGFFHLSSLSGSTASATMRYIIRDHDRALYEQRKALMLSCVEKLNQQYGAGTVECILTDQYKNMAEEIVKHPHLLEIAGQALRDAGVEVRTVPLRGGTDGAQLTTDKGLPCPDLGEGSAAHHGPYEHASKRQMDQCVQVLLNIIQGYARLEGKAE